MLGTAISSHCWPRQKRKPRIPHLGPTRRRAFVEHAVAALGVSERRACRAVGQVRSSQWRRPTGRSDEEPLTEAIIAYAGDYGGSLILDLLAGLGGLPDCRGLPPPKPALFFNLI